MIRAYYTQAPPKWLDEPLWSDIFLHLTPHLPATRLPKLQAIRHQQSQITSTLGLLLLQYAMQQHQQDQFLLQDIVYSDKQKPHCPNCCDFNISHSGLIAGCAVNDEHLVGIDVERHRDVDLAGFARFFASNDFQAAKDDMHLFFELWTKKEAVVKAEGRSGVWDMSKVVLDRFTANYKQQQWHLYKLNLPERYSGYIAYNKECNDIQCIHLPIDQLLANVGLTL